MYKKKKNISSKDGRQTCFLNFNISTKCFGDVGIFNPSASYFQSGLNVLRPEDRKPFSAFLVMSNNKSEREKFCIHTSGTELMYQSRLSLLPGNENWGTFRMLSTNVGPVQSLTN